MNKTEQIAFNWLLTQKIPEKDIIFQKSGSPDFLIKDGRSFEVKKLYGNKILLSRKQFELMKDSKTVLLVIDENKNEPILKIHLKDIKNKTNIDGIMIHWRSDEGLERLIADIPKEKKKKFSILCVLLEKDEKEVIEEFVDVFIEKNKGALKNV